MLASPILPATFFTFAPRASRKPNSSGDSGPAVETFFPGILIPNHQSNTKTATTAMVTRNALKKILEIIGDDTDGIPVVGTDRRAAGRRVRRSRSFQGSADNHLGRHSRITRAFSGTAERTD